METLLGTQPFNQAAVFPALNGDDDIPTSLAWSLTCRGDGLTHICVAPVGAAVTVLLGARPKWLRMCPPLQGVVCTGVSTREHTHEGPESPSGHLQKQSPLLPGL